jgi:hypothetical protein
MLRTLRSRSSSAASALQQRRWSRDCREYALVLASVDGRGETAEEEGGGRGRRKCANAPDSSAGSPPPRRPSCSRAADLCAEGRRSA